VGMIPVDRWTSDQPPRPVRRPMLHQEWRDCAFLHWRYAPDVLRPHVPAGFRLDIADGAAWVSLVTFGIPMMRPASLPPVPGLRAGAESHLRTYVVDREGRRGIWLLSLDIAPLPAAGIGRCFLLPYWPAKASILHAGNRVTYRFERLFPPRTQLEMELEIDGTEAQVDELDRFLTSRWILYSGIGPATAAIFTEHPPWTFRSVSVQDLRQTMTASVGLPASATPLVHFSSGVPARLSWPHPMLPTGFARTAAPMPTGTDAIGGDVAAPGDQMPASRDAQEALVDDAIDASFPASDPPSYGGRAT
jgi:uncharacterized protein